MACDRKPSANRLLLLTFAASLTACAATQPPPLVVRPPPPPRPVAELMKPADSEDFSQKVRSELSRSEAWLKKAAEESQSSPPR